MLRRRAFVVLLAGASLLSVAPAASSTGVSIDVGKIAIAEKLVPGGVYELPALGVRNPGTHRTTYRLVVTYVDGQESRRPPELWFRFAPSTVELDAGESRLVRTRLEVSTDAEPGTYAALIGPRVVADERGAQVGAAAAARLSFEVAPASDFAAWLRRLEARFGEYRPWSWLVPALLLVVLVLQLFRRRSVRLARRA